MPPIKGKQLHPFRTPTPSTSRFPSLMLLVAVVVATVTVLPEGAEGQANMGQSLDFWQMTEDQKILFLADFLANHDQLTRQLVTIAESLQWLQQGTGSGIPGTGDADAVPKVLDALPDVFSNSIFKLAVYLGLDEISRAVPTDPSVRRSLFNMTVEKTAPYHVPVFSAAFNDTLDKLTAQYILRHTNWPRGINRFLAQFSARDVLYQQPAPGSSATAITHGAPAPPVSPKCYNDTMDFIDATVGATLVLGNGSGVDSLNLRHYQWAFKMLDSYGKVSGGIMKGAVHYVGSYEECISVHAYLPNNSSLLLGRRPHDYVTDFGARFCRVTFDLPDAVIKSFGVDTRGITLRLHWGMCFPDSCHKEDVAHLFQLGPLAGYNLNVHSVYCVEDQDVGDDASAIVAIVILALLGGTVVLCTLVEAAVQFYNNNFLTSANTNAGSDSNTKSGIAGTAATAGYHNYAYQATEGGTGQDVVPSPPNSNNSEKGQSSGLPPNYVHHQEAEGEGEGYSEIEVKAVLSANGDGAGAKRSPPPPSYSSARAEKDGGGSSSATASAGAHGLRVPKVVGAFSILTNMPKILSGKKSPNAIHCLHGIRFFSMLWIMLGHTYNYGIVSAVDNPTAVNLVDADAIFRRFTFQAIMAGGFTVDTFFVLSGFLVTYLTLKDMSKGKKKISYWIMFYVHRFWRLTPVYMIVLMTFGCLHIYLGGGPLWPDVLDTAANCKDYWWTNLLYVNNLVHTDNMCMGWTWYLANDMQFYWISPFLLLPLFFVAPLGVTLTLMLGAMGISLSFYFDHKNGGGDLLSMHEEGNHYWEEVYITPWCRVAAYTVGILLGFLMYRVKKTTLKISTAVIGWILTWGVGLFLCYITYTKNQSGGEDWSADQYSAYEAFGRPAWAMCVAWIIFACHNDRGGFINSILSWEGFLPVSRLTYSAYLVHPVVMILHVFTKKYLFYIDDFDLIYLYMGHVVTSFLTAFVFSLVAESPALALEKLLFRMR